MAVELQAMRMKATIRAHTGVIAPLWVTVGMFVAVGAHNARPTL